MIYEPALDELTFTNYAGFHLDPCPPNLSIPNPNKECLF